ncbi:MAG: hypothetical protein MUE36_07035 [Acidimicrobiales bacterium]|nr:hypothetical protein [Acidimicrobiales bacterium]
MVTPKATEGDRLEAIRLLLVGLAAGQDVSDLVDAVAGLHPRNDPFPGEVFMRLAAEVVADTTAAGAGPISYSGLRERHLAEYELVGKENRKFQYAVLCSAAVAGGLEPDLLDEVSWWRTDDFWRYALLAAVALTRAAAERRGVPVAAVVAELAARHQISIPGM